MPVLTGLHLSSTHVSVANVSVVAASIQTRGHTAVDVFKLTDNATGGKVSAEKFEQLRRGMVHRARRQAISQSLGHSLASSLAASTPSMPPPPEDLALIDQACKSLPPFAQLMPSERAVVRADMAASLHRA